MASEVPNENLNPKKLPMPGISTHHWSKNEKKIDDTDLPVAPYKHYIQKDGPNIEKPVSAYNNNKNNNNNFNRADTPYIPNSQNTQNKQDFNNFHDIDLGPKPNPIIANGHNSTPYTQNYNV